MSEHIRGLRTHFCGELRDEHDGESVTLMGWVHRRRDHGGLIFVNLRDRYGVVQVVFRPDAGSEQFELAGSLSAEDVIRVEGAVGRRPEGAVNPEMPTGEVEVEAESLEILSKAATTPFEIRDEVEATDELRLTYRYLDLRRPLLQRNILARHSSYQIIRRHLSDLGFIEVETPVLMKSTPEGARDYLVPSRIHKGRFYALPQSPQIYKQLLMVAGFDKYFQVVKCFRDEDLRADRQPEHTQIDIEMSFVEEIHVREVTEGLMAALFHDVAEAELSQPFPVMTYTEALSRYGTDKPDIRFGMEIIDFGEVAERTDFKVFRNALDNGGKVCGIRAPGGAELTRKEIDGYTEAVREEGGRGLAFVKVGGEGLDGGVARFFPSDVQRDLINEQEANEGDIFFFVADEAPVAHAALGMLRVALGNRLGLVPQGEYAPVWVIEFPLFEESDGGLAAVHHPFTAPHPDDLELLDSDPKAVRSRAYDLVINGHELGGGSIRNHDAELQRRVFECLGISPEDAEEKFGFLLKALTFGAPPHGGIALGLDRIVMVMLGLDSIRDVIAFPKTTSAVGLMEGAPSKVSDEQLRELGIRTERK